VVGDDGGDVAGVGLEPGHGLLQAQGHPEAVHRGGQQPAHVRVQGRHRRRPPVDDRDLHAPGAQGLGEFQADVARTHDDRVGW